jgi:malate synthase
MRLPIHERVTFPQSFWKEHQELFPAELLDILVDLHQKFEPRRQELLKARKARQENYDRGELPSFLDRSSEAVTGDWRISPLPSELLCRRVEITGPVNSLKMVINMLSRNEGVRADMAMLDFEDSMKPSFQNVLDGYKNVIGAVEGDLSLTIGEKRYQIDPRDKAYVMIRTRGLHLDESNVQIDRTPVAAGLLDFAVTYFHTSPIYLSQGLTPKYYIPKCEHHLEARWWNDLFGEVERRLGQPVPTLRATFLIETLPAAFQAEEILYEIREHAAGLNVGRWDKIFSDIEVLRHHPDRILSDRNLITMTRPWMENYAKRIIQICHSRGAFAMGGMSAFTPGKNPEEREKQRQKVFLDKKREAEWGHDGCWVSHPYFIRTALEAMNFKNQLDRIPGYDKYAPLLPEGGGPFTREGLRTNVRVGIAYLHGWHRDVGCVAFDNLMEDLATLEISRAQTWQWLRHKVRLEDGEEVTEDLVRSLFAEEEEKILNEWRQDEESSSTDLALELARASEKAQALFLAPDLQEFLTQSSEPV